MKKKPLITLLLLNLAISSRAFASLYSWTVQITNPEFELTHFSLKKDKYKFFLPKTSWRCWSGSIKSKRKIESRTLVCNYSIEKTGQLTSFVSCSPQRAYNEIVFDLYDERKKLNFRVMLICRKNKS